jgi:hypothetical protein
VAARAGSCPRQRHLTPRGAPPICRAQGQEAQAPGVPRGVACLAHAQGRASQPQHHIELRSDLMQGQSNPNAINIIIFIILKGINIKNTIIYVININISTIVQSMNIKNIIICGMDIFIFIIIKSIDISLYWSSKY